MGLDCYVRKMIPIEDARLADLNLAGGMFSGNGSDGSFRGKVYAPALLELTGIDLYQNTVPTCEVQEAAKRLAKWIAANPDKDWEGEYSCPAEDLRDLCTLLTVAAEHEAVIVGWW